MFSNNRQWRLKNAAGTWLLALTLPLSAQGAADKGKITAADIVAADIAAANQCDAKRVKLQVLGSGGPELDDRRASSGYLIWMDGKARLLVDIGSGSMLNFERSGARIEDLQALLLSHLHVDHSADLPALVKAAFFTPRQQDLPVLGPSGNYLMPSTSDWLTQLFSPQGAYRYLSEYLVAEQRSSFKLIPQNIPAKPRQVSEYRINDQISVAAVPVHHGPIPALAWQVRAAGCKLTFSGDMSNRYQTLAGLAAGSDILVAHNAVPAGARGVARGLHMTPDEIGSIAGHAQVKLLLLSHRMKRTLGQEADTQTAIQARYNGDIRFADDLQQFVPPGR
ncbi:MBL fold metallo-hydrolase [Marinobacterium jannaschii]|uniref:MBL fold metallo-hydrolase n=1 Tax=Marinobacterium jannaschii TaxID=64970 RepID=UPI000A00574E|nr:MBL fold metallo-hydrolase [Marinobacterium jannaschii]